MYNGMSVYRGVISYRDDKNIYAYVPALTGSNVPMKVSTSVIDPDVVVGEQVILAVEDDKAYNIHVLSRPPGIMAQDGGSA